MRNIKSYTVHDIREPDTEIKSDALKCTARYGKGRCHFQSLFNKEKAFLPEGLSPTWREDSRRF